jgi:signal transduction histidine kinase
VSLGDTLRPLVTVVDADFRAAGVEVELKTTGAESLVAGDPGHLRQMLLNLLLNAREAMPGGGRIDVSVEPWKGAGVEPWKGAGVEPWKGAGGEPGGDALGVEVVVRDNGPGFSAEALLRAAEPFYSTKRLGTGLGLANVKRLVEDHGGELVLGNRPEGGAEVRLRLRAAEVGVGRSIKNGRTD